MLKNASGALHAEVIEPGASARSDDRKVFQDMIQQASLHERPFDTLVIHSLSRFARNQYNFHFYKHQLEKKGVRIQSVTQNLSTELEHLLICIHSQIQDSQKRHRETSRS